LQYWDNVAVLKQLTAVTAVQCAQVHLLWRVSAKFNKIVVEKFVHFLDNNGKLHQNCGKG